LTHTVRTFQKSATRAHTNKNTHPKKHPKKSTKTTQHCTPRNVQKRPSNDPLAHSLTLTHTHLELKQTRVAAAILDPRIILLQKAHVEQRNVIVDHLEQETFQQQRPVVAVLRAVILKVSQAPRNHVPHPVHQLDLNRVDARKVVSAREAEHTQIRNNGESEHSDDETEKENLKAIGNKPDKKDKRKQQTL
jgi:hypothetical protein